MGLNSSLKPVVDLPVWEWGRFAPAATAAISASVSDWNCYYIGGTPRFAYYVVTAALYRYDTVTDAWQQLASDPITPTNCTALVYNPSNGYFGKAIGPGPGQNTIQMAALNGTSLNGSKIWIYAGSGAGQERLITGVADPVVHDSGLVTATTAVVTIPGYIEDTTTGFSIKNWKWNQWRDYQFRVTFGPATGGPSQIRRVLYNTNNRLYFADNNYSLLHGQFSPLMTVIPGAATSFYQIESSIVTVDSPWTTPPDSTSKFVVKTGGLWHVSGYGSGANYVVDYYDIAADVWYVKSTVTNIYPAVWTTLDVAVESVGECCGGLNTDGSVTSPLAAKLGTISTAAAPYDVRTLIDSGQNMQVNKYVNMMIRITGGKGRGQRRLITGNSQTTFIISRDWDVVPDNTSTYQVLGDSNKIYIIGGGSAAIVAHDIIEDIPAIGRQFDFGVTRTFYADYAPKGVGIIAVSAGGTGYAVGDILTLTTNGLATGTGCTVKVLTLGTNSSVATVALLTAGTGYLPSASAPYAVTGGFAGNNGACTILVTANAIPSQPPLGVVSITRLTGSIYGSTLTAPGTGYSPNDLLTVGSGTGGVIRVLTVTSVGGIATYSIEHSGSGYTVAVTPLALANTLIHNSATAPASGTIKVDTICDIAVVTTGLTHNFVLGDTVVIGGCDAIATNLSQAYYGGARVVCGTMNASGVATATCFNYYLPTGGIVNVSQTGGVISSVGTINTAGVGYSTGSGIIPTLASLGVAITSGGTGYSVGDLLLVSGGVGGFVKVATVDAVNTGVITGVTLMNPGTGYTAGAGTATVNTGNFSVATYGGGSSLGSGCTLNISVGSPYSTGSGGAIVNVTAVTGTGGLQTVSLCTANGGTGYGATATLAPTGSAASFNAESMSSNYCLIDNTKNWRPNEMVGKIIEVCLGGPNAVGVMRRIIANTSRTLTVGAAFISPHNPPSVGLSQYVIHDPKPFGTENTNKGDPQQYSWGTASAGGSTTSLVDGHTGLGVVAVTSGGTGYVVDEVLTLSTGTNGKVTVTAVSSGVITAVSLTNPGTGFSAGGLCTIASTTGSGVNATITVTKLNGKNWQVNQWAGKKVKILAGKCVDSNPNELLIASNTATILTLASGWAFSDTPDTTTVYAIMDNWGVVSSAAAGGLTLTTTGGVVTGVPANATVSTAGTGYKIGDIIWVNGPSALGLFIKVTTIGTPATGNVTGFTVLNPGCTVVVSTTYISVCLTGPGTGFVLASGTAVSTLGSATVINDPFQTWGTNVLQTKRFRITAGATTLPGIEVAINTTNAYNQLTVATTTSVTDANNTYAIYSTMARPSAVSVGVSNFMRIFGSTVWDKGRYFLSWRGCGTSIVERYDVTQMIWEFITPGDVVSELHTLGSMFEYNGKDRVYFTKGGDTTGRVMYYNIPTNSIIQCGVVPYGMGTAVQGNRLFTISTSDLAGVSMEYLYVMRQSGTEFWRTLIFW